MGATLGVSRPLVDAGWMPAVATGRAVGQDGQAEGLPRVRHLGRGAAPRRHEESGTIIAVNTDPEAAIFNSAHYGAVADIFDVAEELEKLY